MDDPHYTAVSLAGRGNVERTRGRWGNMATMRERGWLQGDCAGVSDPKQVFYWTLPLVFLWTSKATRSIFTLI